MNPFYSLDFRPIDETPPTRVGDMRSYLVCVRFKDGGYRTFQADHANAYPMYLDDDGTPRCDECPDDGSHDAGCPTSGWFEAHDCDAGRLHPLTNEIIAWAEIPQFDPHATAAPA